MHNHNDIINELETQFKLQATQCDNEEFCRQIQNKIVLKKQFRQLFMWSTVLVVICITGMLISWLPIVDFLSDYQTIDKQLILSLGCLLLTTFIALISDS